MKIEKICVNSGGTQLSYSDLLLSFATAQWDLVLCDFSDISFKVDNFNHSNMIKIQDEWDNITKAIRDAVRLISSFGFVSRTTADRVRIKKWFVRALRKRVFSFSADGVLNPTRSIIKQYGDSGFPFEQISNRFKGTNRSLLFTEEDVSNLLYTKCNQGDTLIIMSILYPWADMRNNFHIDHMHPKSLFTKRRF